MRTRMVLVAAAAAALFGACGKESCPTTAANAENQDMSAPGACTAPAPQQVDIKLNLCEACSHTSPTCTPDLSALGTKEIFLDTRWEICTDNSSCAAQACAYVTCQFSVPPDTYQVHVLSKTGTSASFTLSTSTGATCTGSI